MVKHTQRNSLTTAATGPAAEERERVRPPVARRVDPRVRVAAPPGCAPRAVRSHRWRGAQVASAAAARAARTGSWRGRRGGRRGWTGGSSWRRERGAMRGASSRGERKRGEVRGSRAPWLPAALCTPFIRSRPFPPQAGNPSFRMHGKFPGLRRGRGKGMGEGGAVGNWGEGRRGGAAVPAPQGSPQPCPEVRELWLPPDVRTAPSGALFPGAHQDRRRPEGQG